MKVGLALGSGGAKGLAHIAYLEVLDQLGVKVSGIAGASMGALVGAFYAAGMPAKELRALAQGIGIRDLPRILDLSGFRDGGFIKGKKIEEWIGERLPVRRFEDLKVPLKIVATDFWVREQIVFDKGDLVPAIRASIAIPGVIEPFDLDGRLLVDGGVVNPVPFDLLEGCDFIIAIDVAGPSGSTRDPAIEDRDPGRLEILMGSFGIMGKVIMEQRAEDERIAIYLRPALAGFKSMDFLKAKEILDSVREDALALMAELVRRKVDVKAGRAR